MGLWDRDVENSFDRMFDYNRDGHLDMFEKSMQFEYIEEEIRLDSHDSKELDLGDADFDLDEMDEEERRGALEEAGLDPDDYDDY